MRIYNLYNELQVKYSNRPSSLKENKKTDVKLIEKQNENTQHNAKILRSLNQQAHTDVETFDLNNLKIIGITGSKGKSTVAYVLHKYLEHIGKKSILYSSIEVDSKKSKKVSNISVESPLDNEGVLKDILDEVIDYKAEYLVLEVNESAISKGIVKNLPFTIKALTNIEKDNSFEFMTNEEYVISKKSFFKKEKPDDIFTSFFGMNYRFTIEEFNELLLLSDNEVVTYGSKTDCIMRNADYSNIDYIAQDGFDSVNGIRFNIKTNNSIYPIASSLLDLFNSQNITLVFAILDKLGLLKMKEFSEILQNIQIPGRNEIIKINNRFIVVGMNLYPTLSHFDRYKNKNEIKKVKAMISSQGSGYKYWDDVFKSSKRDIALKQARKMSAEYASLYADFIYITSNDPAASNPNEIANELQININDKKPSNIIIDRKEAIRKAMEELNEGELLFIGGRGNRDYYCKSETELELFTDVSIVRETIKTLGWDNGDN